MTHRYLADIRNPQTRIDEFDLRMRRGSALEVRQAVLEAMSDSYPPLRQRGGLAAAEIDDEAFDAILCALAVGDAEAAVQAAVDLGLKPDAAPAPHAPIRQVACLGLRGSRAPKARAALLQAAGDEAADVRYQALVSLHEIGASGEAFGDVIRLRLADEDAEVAVVAAQIAVDRGFGEMGDLLVERWREFQGSNKLQLGLCLAEMAAAGQLELDREALDAVIGQLIDALDDETTIAAASRALVMLNAEPARRPLERLLGRWFGHPILKVEAAGALYQLGSERGKDYLRKALSSSRKDARGYALRLVGRLRIEEFFGELKCVARSPEYHADTAVLALADYGGEEARAVLADVALNHAQHEVRSLAAEALNDLNPRS
jgi:hypothetical protein